MCRTPLEIPVDAFTTVPAECRKCDECRQKWRMRWIGRLLAEEQTADSVWFLTLTFAGGYENEEAYVLQYEVVQKLWKRLRKAGHRFRYVCVGEYGGERGRAHWHALIYWEGPEPEVESFDQRIHWPFWEEGFSQIERPRSKQGSAVYLLDYLNKDNVTKETLKYSKVPQIGEAYCLEYARRHARQGLALFAGKPKHAGWFTIPGNVNRNGELFFYPLNYGEALHLKMMRGYVMEWALHRPDQKLALSPSLTEYLSDLCQDTSVLPERLQAFISHHYGYEPWDVYSLGVTVAVDPYITVTAHGDLIQVQVRDHQGRIEWQAAMSDTLGESFVAKAHGETLAFVLASPPDRPLAEEIISAAVAMVPPPLLRGLKLRERPAMPCSKTFNSEVRLCRTENKRRNSESGTSATRTSGKTRAGGAKAAETRRWANITASSQRGSDPPEPKLGTN